MKIYCNHFEWEELCDTMAFSIQLPFEHCLRDGCPCADHFDCRDYIEDCLKKNWEVHITDV